MTGRVLALLALIVSLAVPAAAQADVVATASGSNAGTRTATFQLTVPQGNDRYLAVGVSTTSANTVTSVTFGAQALTRLDQVTDNGVRSETWVLLSPNVGTAAVSLDTVAVAPVVLGATVFAGVDQTLPVIANSTTHENSANNSASFTTNNTTAKDGMFANLTVTPVIGLSDVFMQASVDTVVADLRWGTVQGTIRGVGATRIGNTGQNMALTTGMNFRWTKTDSSILNPFALAWIALRASTGATQPVVTTPTAVGITPTSATLGGTLASTGGSTITRRGVVYCRCADPVIGGNGVTTVDGTVNDTTGPFTVSANGLTSKTGYTYKAFATNAIGTTYSAAATFTTANGLPSVSAGGPYTGSEDNTAVNLTATGTDPDGDALTYTWDINNDSTFGDLTGPTPSLTRALREQYGINDGAAGKTYPLRVRVSDGTDNATSAIVNLTLNNTVPDATVGNGGAVSEGSTGTVSFSNVTDQSSVDTAAGLRYAYDFDNNGTYDVGGSTYATSVTTSTATVPASFLADGGSTRTVRMVVWDKDNGGHQYTTSITVNNVAPTATFASGAGAAIDEAQQAAAVFSNPQDPSSADTAAGFRYAYDWDNDGTWDVGSLTYPTASTNVSMTIPAQYLRDGDLARTVHGAIIDKDGGVNEYRFTINVRNVAPTATAANRTVQEGQTASVGLTNANDASPADTAAGLRYIYDVDGNATDDTAGVSYANASTDLTRNVPANLTADGPATVLTRIRVIDKDGGSTPYTETVTVTNVKPTAALANSSVDEGSVATVGATGVADPGDLATLHYAYDLDGNATDDTAAVTYAAASPAPTQNVPANLTADGPATVLVRVKVIDKDGESNVYTANVTVNNVAPSFTPNATTPIDEGKIATASVTGVTDPSAADGAAGTRYAYDFDNDGTYDLGSTTYATASPLAQADLPAALTADGPGTQTVKVAVVDKDGGVTAHTVAVKIDNVAPTATLAGVSAVEGTTATIAFTGADDVSAADKAAGFTFEWDADGDGTFEKGAGSIAVPAPDGPLTKTIKGAILDKDGGRHEYTTTLTVTNAVPTASIAGPDAVPSSGATTLTLQIADVGADTVTSALNWGDGTVDAIDGTGEKTATHTYTTSGAKTITLVATDSDGADSAVATHTLTVAAAPAAPAPQTAPPAVTPKQTITGVKITPRCLRADDLRARISKAQTMKVRFSLGTAAPVTFALQRLSGKGGASKCPPARGVKHPDGKRVPGVYRPFTNKSIAVKQGANTVTVAATGKSGKRLAPGTYLLTVTSNGVSARTKLWVLAK